jgi:hypothetical protein
MMDLRPVIQMFALCAAARAVGWAEAKAHLAEHPELLIEAELTLRRAPGIRRMAQHMTLARYRAKQIVKERCIAKGHRLTEVEPRDGGPRITSLRIRSYWRKLLRQSRTALNCNGSSGLGSAGAKLIYETLRHSHFRCANILLKTEVRTW